MQLVQVLCNAVLVMASVWGGGSAAVMITASSLTGEDRASTDLRAREAGASCKIRRSPLVGAPLASLAQNNSLESTRYTLCRTLVGISVQEILHTLPHFKVVDAKETLDDRERVGARDSELASMEIHDSSITAGRLMDLEHHSKAAISSRVEGTMIVNNFKGHAANGGSSRAENRTNRMAKNSGTKRAKARKGNQGILIGGVKGNIRQDGKIILPQFTISEARETKEVCRALQENNQWTPRVEQALWALSPKLQTHILARILKLQTNPSLAWKVFQWAESLPGFAHDSSTFYALIEVLGKAEDIQAIWTLINDMRIADVKVKPIPFTFLISSYGRAGKIKEAEMAFHSMREFNCKPNVYTYNAMLFALFKVHKTERALFTYQKMLVYDCEPDDVTFNTLINGLCVNDHAEAATFYLDEMLKLGFSPDIRTFNIVISSYLKSCQLQKALSVYELALKTGCTPSTITHSMLLDFLFKMGKFEDALDLFKVMANSNHVLDTVAFTTFLHGLLKCNKLEMAFAFYESLVKRGCANVATFNVVLDWLCKRKQIDKAVQVVQDMKRRGISPNTLSYNSLIMGSFKDGRSGMGLAFASQMMEEGCTPDLITYTLLIQFFLKEEEINDALSLLKEMTENGFQPDTHVYNPLMLALFRAGRITLALSVAKEMIQKGCHPNKMTYRVLNSWLRKQGRSAEALGFIQEMTSLGCDATSLLL